MPRNLPWLKDRKPNENDSAQPSRRKPETPRKKSRPNVFDAATPDNSPRRVDILRSCTEGNTSDLRSTVEECITDFSEVLTAKSPPSSPIQQPPDEESVLDNVPSLKSANFPADDK